jgi:CheY-like chemotaxis protein
MSSLPAGERTQVSILLIEPDENTAGFMRRTLERAGYQVLHAPTGKEGLIAAWRDQPDVIVLELDLPDLDGLEAVRRLRGDARTGRKLIISLTNRSGPEQTSEGLETGLDDYIVKQTDAVDVLLRRLREHGDELQMDEGGTSAIRTGVTYVFAGVKGGVGASSLCVNMAHMMAREKPQRSFAVLDLVLPIGALARITGAKDHANLVELTRLSTSELTPKYLRENLPKPKPWAFSVVPGVASPQQARQLNEERLTPLLQTLRSTYHFLFIDIGDNLSRLSFLAIRIATRVLLVLTPDEAGVAHTKAVKSFLISEGIPEKTIGLLTNRPLAVEGLTIDKIEAELGQAPLGGIPNTRENMNLASSLNFPLQRRFPDELTTLTLQEIVKTLLEELETEQA